MARTALFPKSKKVVLLLDERVANAYSQLAKREGSSSTQLMRDALLNHLKTYAKAGKLSNATATMLSKQQVQGK